MSVKLRKVLSVSFAVLLVAAFLTACGGQTAAPAKQEPAKAAAPAAPAQKAAAPAAPAPAPAKAAPITTIRVAYPGEPETKDYPSVLAWRSLPTDKYKVEIIPAAGIAKSTQAVISNEADVASASINLSLNGILKGANVKALAENVGIHWRLIVNKDINKVEDLDKKPVAEGVAGGIDSILFEATRKKYKIAPTIIRANQSSDRIQALINGQVVATVGSAEDFAFADEKKPGQFKIMITYANELPTLGGTYFVASNDFLTKNPQAATDMAEALLKTYRKVNEDRKYLLDEFKKNYKEMSEAKLNKTIDDSYAAKMWNPNGHMDKDTLTYTMQTYFEAKQLPELIPLEKWAANSFIDAALVKLGKK